MYIFGRIVLRFMHSGDAQIRTKGSSQIVGDGKYHTLFWSSTNVPAHIEGFKDKEISFTGIKILLLQFFGNIL